MAKSTWTLECYSHVQLANVGINAAVTASTPLKYFPKTFGLCLQEFIHSATRALESYCRSNTDAGRSGLFQFIPEVLDGVEVRDAG